MTVVAMSHGELSRYDTLLRFERGELRVEDAAMLLGICRRQVYRLLGRLRADGPEALVSWKRGHPSNRAFNAELRTRVVGLVREHYHDFGPTLAAEYLAERHQIVISHETLRKWMIKEGFCKDRDARRPRPYQPRYRRDCRGELIQVDGSKHWWFEDRCPQCTLLVYIDDATSESPEPTRSCRATWRATTSGSPKRRTTRAICTAPSLRTMICAPRWSGASNARSPLR